MQAIGQITFRNKPKADSTNSQKQKILSQALDATKKSQAEKQDLEKLADVSESPLIKIKSHAPFDFFPDELIIDANKVELISNQFFSSSYTNTITLKNIAKVELENGPLHSKLVIKPKLNTQPTIQISFLKKDEAENTKATLQGLIIAHEKNIDLKQISPENLKQELIKIGSI